jgi:hypothetical protein
LSTLLPALLLACGCQLARPVAKLPSNHQVVRDQLVIHCDFRLPKKHRLIEELEAGGHDLRSLLKLPPSDEPIQVYLFDNEKEYQSFLRERFPEFPDRRAIFVKDDTTLSVFAFWGERVGEDLRHEVTHGFLHAVIPDLPLWLDEGLAEYFEVGRGKHGRHLAHIATLSQAYRDGTWSPNLRRLESLDDAAGMAQIDYAESWLWVHYLLESTPTNRQRLQAQLARFRMSGDAEPMSVQWQAPQDASANPGQELIQHLRELAESIAPPD